MIQMLVIISGPEKSGKMPLARALMKQDPSLILVHRDFLRSSFESQVDEGDITLLMADLVRGILQIKRSPIIVAWNLEQSDLDLWYGIAYSNRVPIKWLDVRYEEVKKMIPEMVTHG